MQVLSVLENLNISPKLQSLKFMRGFATAKSFLIQLKSLKQHQSIDKKPQNSLAFSPIAEHSSVASQQNTNREIGRGDVITARETKREGDRERRDSRNSDQGQSQRPKQVGIEYLKNQINSQAKQLNEMHSQLVFTEKAIDVLAEKLRHHSETFRRIESLKHEERQKNIRLIALKSSVDKKKAILQELTKNRDKFQVIFRTAIKNHLIDQQQNFLAEPVLYFAKQIAIKQGWEVEEQEMDDYPERLQLKFKSIKKKEKEREKRKEDVFTQQFIKEKQKDKDKEKEEKRKLTLNQFNKMGADSSTYYDSEFIDS